MVSSHQCSTSTLLFVALAATSTASASCRSAATTEDVGGTVARVELRPASGNPRGRTIFAASTSGDQRRVVTFEGTCDASGAVELDERTLVVADDENNVLRVYDAERGGPPLQQFDVSQALGLEKPHKAESDLEAATRAGDRAYFLASHGRTAKGKRDDDRLMFFATTLPRDGNEVTLIGAPYRSLLDDLTNDARLARFRLKEASLRRPKDPDGLNIEGMTSQPDGSLLIGFRSPVPDGQALLVRLLNPDQVIRGGKARLSDPVRLELGGLGVRALSAFRSGYLVAAGPTSNGGPFQLLRVTEGSKALPLAGVDLSDFAAEGLFTPSSGARVLVLSDDGTREVEGAACKKLKDPAKKSFRGVWVELPP